MIPTAILLLVVAICLGGYMLARVVRVKRSAPRLALLHALLALSAIGALVARIHAGPKNLILNSALFILALALIGGLLLAFLRDPKQPPMLPFIVLHAACAVVGLGLVIAGFLIA